jgi:mannose-6-phosphate isomerase-like protein (cupin superfamily)
MTSSSTLRVTRPPLPTTELAAVVREIAAHTVSWQHLVHFGTDERWWTRLRSDDDVEVWLLTWLTGTGTDLHDHGGSAAAFTVVEGTLSEVRASRKSDAKTVSTLHPGGTREVAPDVIHDVSNPSVLPAVSIHAYSPPLQAMTFYDAVPSGLRVRHTALTNEPEPTA